MRDKILGDIEFDDCVWWRSMQKSLFGSDEDVELLIQDENNEGILDVQREAFLTYEKNEDRYIKDVPRYIIDYYKWYFEVIEKRVKLDEEAQKETISESSLSKVITIYYVFICRDGSFGWIIGRLCVVDN